MVFFSLFRFISMVVLQKTSIRNRKAEHRFYTILRIRMLGSLNLKYSFKSHLLLLQTAMHRISAVIEITILTFSHM